MTPIIKIMSRDEAMGYAYKPHKKTSVIISISSMWEDENDLPVEFRNNKIRAVLYLNFNDVEEGLADHIKRSDANQIAEFVEEWKHKVDIIIVHCGAGISRSSGVGAAIMQHLFNDASPVFDSPDYMPNITCYRYVLNAFQYLDYFKDRKVFINPNNEEAALDG